MDARALPPTEDWWPHLDIPHKQWIIANIDDELSDAVVAAIWEVCRVEGEPERGIRLTIVERQFIVTQMEAVD